MMPSKPKRLTRKFFQQCGSVGGKNHAAKMTPEERKALGQQLTAARLAKQKGREEESASAVSPAPL